MVPPKLPFKFAVLLSLIHLTRAQINPCDREPCDENAFCSRVSDTQFTCTCNDPFVGDGRTCIIPDPCIQMPCDDNASCTRDNVLNSEFTCTCNDPFEGDGFTCEIPDPCLQPDICDENSSCTRDSVLNALFTCTCNPPFEGDGETCVIPDPCLQMPCDDNASCRRDSVLNSEFTCTCNDPFQGDGFTCEIPDPCLQPDICDENASCTRDSVLNALFTCTCQSPFEGDGETCVIPDPCLQMPCDDNASCRRDSVLNAEFTCTCNDPFVGDGFTCEIPDPCSPSPCGVGADCTVFNGQPVCACPEGYQGNPFMMCSDVNECENPAANNCHQEAVCTNMLGGFTCTCRAPFVGDGRTCEIDPCSPSPCGLAAECTSSNNRAVCTCPMGFQGDPLVSCRDVNECENPGMSKCHQEAVCTNTLGGYTCTCRAPFAGDGFTCEIPDPCSPSPCGQAAECTVSNDRAVCTCPMGYQGDPLVSCRDVNECENPATNNCHQEAVCTNTLGGFTCTCKGGYVGDGVTCNPEKEVGMMDDPHILTWSGSWFDYHGQCDLVLIHAPNFQSTNHDLMIHARTTIRYEYSFIETAVLRLGDIILEVGSFGDYFLNGVNSGSFDGGPVTHTQPTKKKHRFDVTISPNTTITLSSFKDLVSIKIHGGTEKEFGNSVGIMGSFDGRLLGRDGKTIMTDMNAFGQEWQVTIDEPKLFQTIRGPQAPNRCILPPNGGTRESRNLRGRRLAASPIAREEALEACSYLSSAPSRDACIYDVIAVGDTDIASGGEY